MSRMDAPQTEPACWSWEVPAILPTFRNEDAALQYLSDWHQYACAICGCLHPDVTDHDHQTALIRGELCRSCNIMEGCSVSVLIDNYRMRNPASILGIQVAYWDPWRGEAQPQPVLTDRERLAEERKLRDLVDRLPIVLPPGAAEQS